MPLPVAHTAPVLCGAAALRRNFEPFSARERRLVLGLALLLSVSPDFDFLPGVLFGDPNRFHHGPTHSILGAAAIGCAAWLLVRALVSAGGGKLLLVCVAAPLSHVLLDLFSADPVAPYGVPLLWPLSERYFIAPFPLFPQVLRENVRGLGFFRGLLIPHNAYAVAVELLFTAAAVLATWGFILPLKRRWRAALLVSAFAAFLGYWALQIEPNRIEVAEYEIHSSKVTAPLTLVHLSDLHLRRIGFRELEVRRRLEEIRPDAVLISGDLFDPFGEGYKLALAPHMKRLTEYVVSFPGKKFLVWGEGVWNNRHHLGSVLEERGIRILEDEEEPLGSRRDVLLLGLNPRIPSYRIEKEGESSYLAAGIGPLNSFLHVRLEGSSAWRDYEVRGRFRAQGSGGIGVTIYSKYGRRSDRFYRLRAGAGRNPYLDSHGTGRLQGRLRSRAIVAPERWHRFRLECRTSVSAVTLRAKVWPAGETEPGAWMLEGRDRSPLRIEEGTAGVWCNARSGYRHLDDFEVRAADGRLLFRDSFDGEALEPHWEGEVRYGRSVAPSRPGAFTILLAHDPRDVLRRELEGIDLALAGGTHGGQICWPWGRPVLVPEGLPAKFASGLHRLGEALFHVSRGIGTSRLPARLFCRPEIAVFRVKPAEP